MRKLIGLFSLIQLLFILSCSGALKVAEVDSWLNRTAGNTSPMVDISGVWQDINYPNQGFLGPFAGWGERSWGKARFEQKGKNVTGSIGDYVLKGVVNGNKIYLAMIYGGSVYYTANLEMVKNNEISGNFYYSKDKEQLDPYPMVLLRSPDLTDRNPLRLPMVASDQEVKLTTEKQIRDKISSEKNRQPAPPHLVPPTSKHIPSTEVKEYVSWGLGVIVKTDQKTTIKDFVKEGNRLSKELLKVGDEIIKVGKDNLDPENAYKILTRSIQVEADDLVPVIVRRESKDITYRIKPNW